MKVTAETKFGSTQNNDGLPNTASCTGPGTDVSPVPEKSSNSPISAQSMATPSSARRAGDNRGGDGDEEQLGLREQSSVLRESAPRVRVDAAGKVVVGVPRVSGEQSLKIVRG